MYAAAKPDIMLTHDCPLIASDKMFVEAGLAIGKKNARSIRTKTAMALETMLEIHQPKVHFFGHWHITKEWDYKGCHFHCIGQNEAVDFDFKTMNYIRKGILP